MNQTTNTLTDYQLLAQAKVEATLQPPLAEAFEAILLRYQRLIHYIGYQYFKNQQDAQDRSQETALKIYNALPRVTITEDGSLKAWIATVATRTCLDFLRRHSISTVEFLPEHVTDNAPSAEDDFYMLEDMRDLRDKVEALPTNYRVALTLRDIEGFSYEAIANMLEINIGTVKSRINRARASLKKLLK